MEVPDVETIEEIMDAEIVGDEEIEATELKEAAGRWPEPVLYRADLLRAMRAAKGLTLADVAHKTGLSSTTVSNIMQGRESVMLATLAAICKVLGLKMRDVFDVTKSIESITGKAA